MKDFYEPRKFEFDEEKFNESLVLADQDNPGGSFSKMMEWSEAIGYVARAYWAHFKDEKKTFHYFKKLYDQGGITRDYVSYGLCYFYGYGVEKDLQKACKIIEKACNIGYYDPEKPWIDQMYIMVRNETRYQEIQEELAKTKEELAQTKEELAQTKETLEARLEQTKDGWKEYIEKYHSKCKEYSTLEAQLSQTKREWTDKYNQLVNEYNTLLNKSKSTCLSLAAENQSLRTDVSSSSDAKSEMASKYNQLVSRYNELCDQYERLVAENARNAALAAQTVQTVQSSQSMPPRVQQLTQTTFLLLSKLKLLKGKVSV
jgi:DNA repair exonuclease SbcCD ATPase subunit